MDRSIVIRSGKLGDFRPEELADLVDRIHQATDDDVSIGVAEKGRGALPEIILHVRLLLEGYAGGKVIDKIVDWARAKWRERRDESRREHQQPPPLVVSIIGPRGEVLRQVKIDLPEGEPQP